MGRRLLLGVALFAGIVTPGAWLEANTVTPAGETRFTLGWVGEEPTLRVEGRGVKFFKRVGRERVVIRVEVPGDVVEIEAESSGAVRLGRKGRYLRLQMRDNFDASIAKVQKLVAGSTALDGFEGLMASLVSVDTPQVRSLRSSHALISAVRGVTVPVVPGPQLSASRGQASRAAFTRSEEGPLACWAEYAWTVYQANVVFNECVEDYWWIPGWTATCGFQFALQSELAWFWLLSCSGGMPV